MATNYEELARQSGAISSVPGQGKVDYSKLAQESGAVQSIPPEPMTGFQKVLYGAEDIGMNAALGVAKEAGTQLLNLGGIIREIPIIGSAIKKIAPDPMESIVRPVERSVIYYHPQTGERIESTLQSKDDMARMGYLPMAGTETKKIPEPFSLFGKEGQKALGIAPEGIAQKSGAVALDMAEFAAPASKIAQASKALGALPMVQRLGASGEFVAKAIPEAAAAFTIGKLQDRETAGAPLILMAGVSPAYQKALNMAGKKLPTAIAEKIPEVQLSPRQMLFKALKPINRNLEFEGALNKGIPEIYAQAQSMGMKIESLDDFIDVTKAAKKRIWGEYQKLIGNENPFAQEMLKIDGNKIADAMIDSVPSRLRIKDPAGVATIESFANTYRRPLTIEEAESFLKNVNAETEAYYALFPRARATKAEANMGLGASLAESDALRKEIYGKLDIVDQLAGNTAGKSGRSLKEVYGSLINIENEAYRRVNVAKRLAPQSLVEQLGMLKAAGKFAVSAVSGNVAGGAGALAEAYATRAAARWIKERNTSEYLLKKAMADYGSYVDKLTKGQRFAYGAAAGTLDQSK